MVIDPEEEARFPRAAMATLFAEVACWTSLESIIHACRIVEGSALTGPPFLAFAFPNDPLLEAVLLRTFACLVPVYSIPAPKLAIAARLAPDIRPKTLEAMAAWRINPTIHVGQAAAVAADIPRSELGRELRAFRFDDTPPSLELMFDSFRMLHVTILDLYEEASGLRIVEQFSRATSDNSELNVVHQHNGDSALAATLDALVYFAMGAKVGVQWAEADRRFVENSFRSVNIVGRPPLDARLFDVGREAARHVMEALRDDV